MILKVITGTVVVLGVTVAGIVWWVRHSISESLRKYGL